MRTYKIHLIRHGLTNANRRGIYCGSTDLPLDPEGVTELHHLLDGATYPCVEWVFCSPLLRATETAGILYPAIDIIEIENLREASFGEFEGKSMEELQSIPGYARFVTGDAEFLPRGAEPPDVFFHRSVSAGAAIIDLMMKSGVHSAAIITHASVIGNILAGMGYPKAAPTDWMCPPGGGYTVIADPTIFCRESVVEVVSTLPENTKTETHSDEVDWDMVDWEDESLDDLMK